MALFSLIYEIFSIQYTESGTTTEKKSERKIVAD